jgi:hypothetical protein
MKEVDTIEKEEMEEEVVEEEEPIFACAIYS